MTVNPENGTVYVTTFRNVVVIDTTPTPTIVANIDVGEHAQEIKVSPDHSMVYEANYYSGDLWVIDTATNTVIGEPIPVGADADAVAVTPRWHRLHHPLQLPAGLSTGHHLHRLDRKSAHRVAEQKPSPCRDIKCFPTLSHAPLNCVSGSTAPAET